MVKKVVSELPGRKLVSAEWSTMQANLSNFVIRTEKKKRRVEKEHSRSFGQCLIQEGL